MARRQKAPAYQTYPKDLLSDETYQLMTYAERGVYRDLLDRQWLEGSIPSDLNILARLLHLPLEDLKTMWFLIGKCFVDLEGENGRIVNRKMRDQWEEYECFRETRVENGRRGGRPAGSKTVEKPTRNQEVKNKKPKRNLRETSASAIGITLTSNTGDIPPNPLLRVEESVPFPPVLDTEQFRGAWRKWLEYRKGRKSKPYQDVSLRAVLAMLAEQPDPIEVIEQSIRQGWQGLFPVKNQTGGTNARKRETLAEQDERLKRECERITGIG